METLWIQPDRQGSKTQLPCCQPSTILNENLISQFLSLDNMGVLDPALSTRRNRSTAVEPMPLASQSCVTSAVQPTFSEYQSKLNRIEALKATAASLSNRIESEAKKLAGSGINYGAVWNSDRDLLQGTQGDGYRAKPVSPPVKEDHDVFSARLQMMLGTCSSHTNFDDNLPGVGNLSEFKKLPETISPRAASVSLSSSHRSEGILGNLSRKQTCSLGAENSIVVPQECSRDSISEGPLSDGLLSEEEVDHRDFRSLKAADRLQGKEFCVADPPLCEPLRDFKKEAEKYLPLFTQLRSSQGPWEELAKGSPHSAINIFAKSYQRGGKGKGKNINVVYCSRVFFE